MSLLDGVFNEKITFKLFHLLLYALVVRTFSFYPQLTLFQCKLS